MKSRLEKLAKNLVQHSVKAKAGERVMLLGNGVQSVPLLRQLIKEVHKVGALPIVELQDSRLKREILFHGSDELFTLMDELEMNRIRQMDCYIGFSASENISELSDVPYEKMQAFEKFTDPSFSHRVDHTRWVVLRYPTPAMAQLARMSQEAFEDFYFDVCTLDYSKMEEAMEPLKQLMEKTDKVRIVGPGTDLRFSIKGMPAIKCAGSANIPDGEIYTAPIKDSVEGVIRYNTPSLYQGFIHQDITLRFEKGRIVEATSNDSDHLNKIFDTDEGARYVGEFAIGVHPLIEKPMLDTLFDEKIKGSFHFTPGSSYDTADNGNNSAVHWDLVTIQTPEHGGGEIWFDDVLIRKDGLFVVEDLVGLNPEQLL